MKIPSLYTKNRRPDRLAGVPAAQSSRATSEGEVESGLIMQHVCITFKRSTGERPFQAISDVSMEIEPKQFCCVVGPSGCGKSSLLLAAAGLVPMSSGHISINGRNVQGPGLGRAVVFQSASLFPWRTVMGNVIYGLELRKVGKPEARKRAQDVINLVGLTNFSGHFPHELSGGMQQRVNLARALVVNPRILLMDEPFASLDAQTRETMQAELLRVWEQLKKSVLFVTHQIDEAVYLGDKVVVLTKGPGTRVAETIDVPFERPRSERLKRSPDFMEIVDRIWNRIRAGQ